MLFPTKKRQIRTDGRRLFLIWKPKLKEQKDFIGADDDSRRVPSWLHSFGGQEERDEVNNREPQAASAGYPSTAEVPRVRFEGAGPQDDPHARVDNPASHREKSPAFGGTDEISEPVGIDDNATDFTFYNNERARQEKVPYKGHVQGQPNKIKRTELVEFSDLVEEFLRQKHAELGEAAVRTGLWGNNMRMWYTLHTLIDEMTKESFPDYAVKTFVVNNILTRNQYLLELLRQMLAAGCE